MKICAAVSMKEFCVQITHLCWTEGSTQQKWFSLMIQEYSYLEGHYSTKHCQIRWSYRKPWAFATANGLSLDKYSSNAPTGQNAGFSLFSYILPSPEESNGSSFSRWLLSSSSKYFRPAPSTLTENDCVLWRRRFSPPRRIRWNMMLNQTKYCRDFGSGDDGSYD